MVQSSFDSCFARLTLTVLLGPSPRIHSSFVFYHPNTKPVPSECQPNACLPRARADCTRDTTHHQLGRLAQKDQSVAISNTPQLVQQGSLLSLSKRSPTGDNKPRTQSRAVAQNSPAIADFDGVARHPNGAPFRQMAAGSTFHNSRVCPAYRRIRRPDLLMSPKAM